MIERDLWAREDELRNFEHGREAYINFYESLRQMARSAYGHGMGFSDPPPREAEGELPFEWNQEAFYQLEHLRIYASPAVLAAAGAAYRACWQWGNATRHGSYDDLFYERQEEFNSAELSLYDAIRRDLGLGGAIRDGRPLPGSGWSVDEE